MHVMRWEEVGDPSEYPVVVRDCLQSSSDEHGHEFFEFVYVQDGFCLHFTGSDVRLLMPGDFLALPPGCSHHYRCRRNVTIYNILFMREALDGLMPEINALPGMEEFFAGEAGSFHGHLALEDRESMQRLIDDLSGEQEHKPSGWELRKKALLVEMLVLVSRLFGERFGLHQADNPYLGYALYAISAIDESYQTPLTVGGIATNLGISPDHLTRQFKQATGITPTEYLKRQRFAKALELLRAQRPVNEVCCAVGYKQISQFSREFKTLFHMTPTAFQRQVRDSLQKRKER